MDQRWSPLNVTKSFAQQRELLSLFYRDTGEEINTFHGVAGRGGGKTVALVLLVWASCVESVGRGGNRGLKHCITAPTYGMIDRFIVPTWRAVVGEFGPDGDRVWTYYKSSADKKIVFSERYGGSEIYLVSRDDPDKIRGNTFAFVVHDEIGMDREPAAWENAELCIRNELGKQPGKPTHVGISTPRLGWWADKVQSGGDPWVHWTSYDNPWRSEAQIKRVEANLGTAFARQEIYADFISLTGRIWDEFVDAVADGNREPGGHVGQGYYLAGDLGIHSAWLVIQRRHGIDVVTAEYLPNDEGARQTLARVRADYGEPYRVIVGQDVKTRWEGDSTMIPLQQIHGVFRSIPPVTWPRGHQTDKALQFMAAQGRVCSSGGARRLKVAADLRSYKRDTTSGARGILDMFRQDAWPANPRHGEYLPKDKRYEHVRDALLYYCICEYPPGIGG